MLIGIHCTLDMPLDKIVRKYTMRSRRRILKVILRDCVTVFREPPVAGTVKKWLITWKVRHHIIEIGDYNTIDYLTYLMRTGVFVDATNMAALLNTKIAKVEVERTQDHITAGAKTVADLRDLTMDDELAEEVRKSLDDERKAHGEAKKQATIAKLQKLGVSVTMQVDDGPDDGPPEEPEEKAGGGTHI
jgi:hypothetical protein